MLFSDYEFAFMHSKSHSEETRAFFKLAYRKLPYMYRVTICDVIG